VVWVKVCGITDVGEAIDVSGLGPDALGFILSTDSRRRISVEQAERIIGAVRKKYVRKAPQMAGVFVNEDFSYIREAAERLELNIVQFCGYEDADYLSGVKKLGNLKIIKAISCQRGTDIASRIHKLKKLPDYYLLDTYSRGSYGGTGRTFDWNMVKNLSTEGRIILAGGLGPDNVYAAISTVKPYGVDASSGLEAGDGKKDIEKVRVFIENAKGQQGEQR